MRARDVPASVRRAYEIAGKQYPGDAGPHTAPAPPSPRSNRAWERHGAHSGPHRRRTHGGGGGFVGFGRELEVLLLICIVACVPLLGGVGKLPTSRLTKHDLRQATGFVADSHHHRDPAGGWTERQRKLAQREGYDKGDRAYDGALGREGGKDEGADGGRGKRASSTDAKSRSSKKPKQKAGFQRRTPNTGVTPPGDTGDVCGDGEAPERGPVRIWDGVEIRGGDLRRGPPIPAPATREDCCLACMAEPDCRGWVLVKEAGVCWLKGRWAGDPEADSCCEGADMRPGGDARMREAARKTAELEEQRGYAREVSFGTRSKVARGGSAERAEELRLERDREAKEALAKRKAPPLHMPGRIGGHLLVLVPTVARPGVDYLTRTVDSILDEARKGEHGFARVTVRVVSHSSAQEHVAFRKIRDRPAGPKDMQTRVYLEAAVDADRRRMDPGAGRAASVDDKNNPDDVPGPRVRQQTLDLVSVLRDVGGVGGGGGADYVLLTEDDATMCPGHLAGIGRKMAAAAAVDPMWTMLRTSIGFIGIVMHRADTNALANFLETHYQRKPPDILLIEWVAGNWEGGVRAHGARARGEQLIPDKKDPTLRVVSKSAAKMPLARGHFVSLKNAFEHIGEVSSLRATHASVTPDCDAPLTSFLWALERFKNPARCADAGIVPCERAAPREPKGIL